MATWLYDMITMIIYVHKSFHSREDILPSLSHSGLVTLTNVTARMAPASLAIEDSLPPIVSTLNSPPQSSVTSEQTDNHLPPTTTAPEQAFPEYPNGNITIQLRAHEHDDFMSTGWATSYSSHWKVVGGKARQYKCLGVMVCTTDGCPFVIRPKQKQSHWPKQLSTLCKTHNTGLKHIECKCSLTWK